MKEPPPATNCDCSFLKAFALAFLAALFCACSEDPVKVSATQSNLVFDMEAAGQMPSQRLSVFVEVYSNPRRLESVTVRRGDYSWNIDSPVLIQSGGRSWAGSSRLEPPPGPNAAPGWFEPGLYTVECVDAAGEKSESSFYISYDTELLKTEPANFAQKFSNAQSRVAVYSDANELLYFDARKDNWFDDSRIFKDIKNSSFYREALFSGSSLCFMPKIYKDGEKSDGIE